MTSNRHGTAVRHFPSDLVIVTTRQFDAPINLVFAVMTQAKYTRLWWATGGDTMTVSDIDFRVGGHFHNVFETPDGTECSFRGTFLDIEEPVRFVNSWLFEGWPDAWATETHEFHEVDGVTTLTLTVTFRDAQGRAHMDRSLPAAESNSDSNGHDASLDAMEDLLTSLVASGTQN